MDFEEFLWPNLTHLAICYGYRSVELLDLQGCKLATLLDSPGGTYLVKINFEQGVSVVRKVVKR